MPDAEHSKMPNPFDGDDGTLYETEQKTLEESDRLRREKIEEENENLAARFKTPVQIVELARIPDGAEFDRIRDEVIKSAKVNGGSLSKSAIKADVKRIRDHLGISNKKKQSNFAGYDLAAEASDGTGSYPAAHQRPCYRTHLEPIRDKPAGFYYHGFDKDGNLINLRLCSPLRVLAETRGRNGVDYGLLIEFKNEDGWKKWCVPLELLAAEGAVELKKELMRNGLKITVDGEKQLIKFLREFESKEKLWSTSTTGWDETSSFVLPDIVLGKGDVYFQSRSIVAPYGSGGTPQGWKDMAALACGNPLLMFGISASFAGPLLKPLQLTGAALHLFGDSSQGKSTIQRASVATWGSPKFKKSWNNTANGIEGYAAMHTDTMLALDEIGEVRDVKVIAEAAYALVNGSGRGAMQSNREMRATKDWRVMTLSSGERTIESVLAKERIDLMAGQQVRFLDIEAAGGQFGAFDNLHGRASGREFADEVTRLAARNYGRAGIAFVERLIARGLDGLAARHDGLVKEMHPEGGQEGRAARVFALCALAGELAVDFGIAPWAVGEATAAAQAAFWDWKDRTRSKSAALKNLEDAQILQRLVDVIERFEDTKFSDVQFGELVNEEVRDKDGKIVKGSDGKPIIRSISHRINGERYGYWETVNGEDGFDSAARRVYYLLPSGFKSIMRGFDHTRSTRALVKHGVLERDIRQMAKVKHVPGKGPVRMYWIDLDKARSALLDDSESQEAAEKLGL